MAAGTTRDMSIRLALFFSATFAVVGLHAHSFRSFSPTAAWTRKRSVSCSRCRCWCASSRRRRSHSRQTGSTRTAAFSFSVLAGDAHLRAVRFGEQSRDDPRHRCPLRDGVDERHSDDREHRDLGGPDERHRLRQDPQLGLVRLHRRELLRWRARRLVRQLCGLLDDSRLDGADVACGADAAPAGAERSTSLTFESATRPGSSARPFICCCC